MFTKKNLKIDLNLILFKFEFAADASQFSWTTKAKKSQKWDIKSPTFALPITHMATPSATIKATAVPSVSVPLSTPLSIILPIVQHTGGIVEVPGRFVPSSYIEPTPQFGSPNFFKHIDELNLRPLVLPGPVPTAEKHFRLYEDYANALDALINIAASEEARVTSIAKDLPFLQARYGVFRAHVERRKKRRDEEQRKARVAAYKPKGDQVVPTA